MSFTCDNLLQEPSLSSYTESKIVEGVKGQVSRYTYENEKVYAAKILMYKGDKENDYQRRSEI